MSAKKARTTAWLVAIIVFLGGVALASCQNKVAPVIDVLMVSLNIGEAAAGWLSSVFTIMGLITAIPASWLINRFGAKNIGIVALAAAALGSALGAFANGVVMLIAARIIEGTGVAMISVAGPSMISMWFPPQKRALPMGLWSSWQGFSQTLLFLVGGGIAAAWSWQGVWWFTFIMCVIVLVLYVWKVDEPQGDQPNYAEADEQESAGSFFAGFKSASPWLNGLAFLFYSGVALGFGVYISLYLAETFYGGDMITSNLIISALYAIEIVVCIVAGMILNRVPLKKYRFVGAAFFVLYAILCYVFFTLQMPALIIPMTIVFPIVEGTLCCILWTLAPSTAKKPEQTSAAIAIQNVCFNTGFVIFPPLVGFFIETSGFGTAALALAVSCLLGGVFVFLVKSHTIDEATD